MAENRAQEELQALLDLQNSAQASEANMAKLGEAREDFVVNDPGDADFNLSEMLPFMVGAGWIMGPVGGLLVGLAQGLLGRRARQNALDRYVKEQEVLSDTNDIFNAELDRLALTARSQDDLDQLSALQTQKDAALELMTSGSARLQQQGSELLSDFSVRLNDYAERQETERIAAVAMNAELERALGQEGYSRYISALDDFNAESAPYDAIMESTSKALQALDSGSPSDLWAASILVNKALDPTSVVREAEAELPGRLTGLADRFNTIVEKARDGTTILPKERQNLVETIYGIRGVANQFQGAREARYKERLIDADVPEKYWDQFDRTGNVPVAPNVDIDVDAPLAVDDVNKAVFDALYPYSDAGIKNNLKYAWSQLFGPPKTQEQIRADAADRLDRIPNR